MNTMFLRRSVHPEKTGKASEKVRKPAQNLPLAEGALHPNPKVDILLPQEEKSNARYKVIEEIGYGGMATVYSAIDTQNGRKVAIKISKGSKENQFMLNEIKTLKELKGSERTVKLLDSGYEDGRWFAVLEFIEGGSLDQLFKKCEEIPWERIQTIVSQLCEGLEKIHEKGIIHRDLKPHNVMLRVTNGGEEVVLVDLGLATTNGHTEEDEKYIKGTPMYMAPEQLFNEKLDVRADIYSVGIILYRMLCGMLPFIGNTGAILKQIIMDEPSPPSKQAEYMIIPGEIEAVAMRAIAKNPAERFQSIGEMRDAVLRCQEGPRMAERKETN